MIICLKDSLVAAFTLWSGINTLRPRQNGRHYADDTFKPIFVNENIQIIFEISPKLVPKVAINNVPALVQIMAWRRPGDKPLSEPMMVCLLTHICVTRPQRVKGIVTSLSSKSTSHATTWYQSQCLFWFLFRSFPRADISIMQGNARICLNSPLASSLIQIVSLVGLF